MSAALQFALVAGWDLARPWGALGLALAALILIASLLRRSTSEEAPRPLGTARFLDDAEGESERGARLWLPPSRLLAIAAVVAGTIALAGPVPPEPRDPPIRLVALVDRSPSMYLPVNPAARGEETRLEAAAAALARAVEAGEWSDALGAEVRIAWRDTATDGAPLETAGLPAELVRPPRFPRENPRWAALDRPGVVWVTDVVPAVAPRAAGLSASGGPHAPGPVGWSTAGPLVETGAGALEVDPGAAPPPTAHIAAGVGEAVAGLARAWASDRGVSLLEGPGGAGLVVSTASSAGAADGDDARVEGAGWTATARGARGGRPIDSRRGRVELGFEALTGPPSDPVAFATELADALDEALLLPAAYVPRSERESAGAAALEPPREPRDAGAATARRDARERRDRLARLAAGLSALAGAALALASGLLRSAGR